MSVDPSGDAIFARLRAASDCAGSLHTDKRLDTKIDLSAAGVTRRLQEASDLLDLCRALARPTAKSDVKR